MAFTEQTDKRSFRQRGWIIAGVFLALIAVLVVLILVQGGGSSHNTTLPTTSSKASTTASSTTSSSGSACGLTDTSQTVPTTAPSGVTWALYKGEALPTSSTDGPGRSSGPAATCYADTPVGALLAAIQTDLRINVSDDADSSAIISAETLPNSGQQKDLAELASGAQLGSTSADYQVAGFQFASYTGANAVINLAMLQTNGGYESGSYTVTWSGGDWKVVLGSDGSISTPFSALSSLTGYVPFSGVS